MCQRVDVRRSTEGMGPYTHRAAVGEGSGTAGSSFEGESVVGAKMSAKAEIVLSAGTATAVRQKCQPRLRSFCLQERQLPLDKNVS
jgi:hypothetical protein